MYNLRPRRAMINYDEDAYFNSIGVKEMPMKTKIVKTTEDDKINLMIKLRHLLNVADSAPINVKPFCIMETIQAAMEYIQKVGDSEKFKHVLKNKINEFMNEPKMVKYSNKLTNYYYELDMMMEIDA